MVFFSLVGQLYYMTTAHDAHEILAAFKSIDKLRTLDDKLDVLYASLILHDDECIRLIRRPRPTQKLMKTSAQSSRKQAHHTMAKLPSHDPPDCMIPRNGHDPDRRLCAIYNSLPFEGSVKRTSKRPGLTPLVAHDRTSVDRFRQYSSHI